MYIYRERERVFCFSKGPDRLWGPPSLMYSGYRGSFTRAKRPVREADYSHSVPRLRMSGVVIYRPLIFVA